MGLFDTFRSRRKRDSGATAPANSAARTGIVSPWSNGQLSEFVYTDIYGDQIATVTRAEAMSVPAVAGARGLILGSLAGRPLRAIREPNPLPPKSQPAWLYRTDTDVPLWHRMAQTLDDWIFYGDCLWIVERGSEGQITDAIVAPRDRWSLDPATGEILVGKDSPKKSEVIYLAGPFEGLLNCATKSIRAAVDVEASMSGRARTPAPAIVLKEKEDNAMTQEEAAAYVKAVALARRDADGAVMFIPYSLDVTFEGDSAADLLIEARNSVKLDIANFLNLPSSLLDAALPKASLNYQTQEGKGKDLTDRLPYWTEPLESRLSMDDVVPRGTRIRFEFSPNPEQPGNQTAPYAED
jgi:hypothetical protein